MRASLKTETLIRSSVRDDAGVGKFSVIVCMYQKLLGIHIPPTGLEETALFISVDAGRALYFLAYSTLTSKTTMGQKTPPAPLSTLTKVLVATSPLLISLQVG